MAATSPSWWSEPEPPLDATLAEPAQRFLVQGFCPRGIFMIQRGLPQERNGPRGADRVPQRVPLPGRSSSSGIARA